MTLLKSAGGVGLELDTGVIRVVELKGTARNASPVAAAQLEIPPEAVAEGVVADGGAVAGALSRLWAKAGISTREVVLGVSNQGVLMRLATFPKILEKKLSQTLHYQAGDYFPLPMEQMVLDFSIIGETAGQSGPELEVLLIAARRDMLEKNIGAVVQAGLEPRVVDASALALVRMLPGEYLSRTVLLADISNGLTTLVLSSGGVPRFSRVLSHSLQTLAREMELTLAGLPETSELVAATSGDDRRDGPDGGVLPGQWGIVLANELRSSIGYYQIQPGAEAVESVFLSGRGSRVPGLAAMLQEMLELPVEPLSPGDRSDGLERLRGIAPEPDIRHFTLCTGLALRGLEA